MQKLEQTNAGDTQSGRARWLGDTLRTPWYHVPRGRTNLAEQVGYERGKGHYLFSRLIQLPSIPGLFRYFFFTLTGEIKVGLIWGLEKFELFFLITQLICFTSYEVLIIITIDEKSLSQFSVLLFLLY